MSEEQDKAIRDWAKQWTNMGMMGLFHSKDTNAYTFKFNNNKSLENALPEIRKNPNVSLLYTNPDHLKEVSDAINDLDYFKAYTLCVALYESIGKTILISQFNDKQSLAEDLADRVSVYKMIITLYKHRLIEEHTKHDMIGVNQSRNAFIHRYLTSKFSNNDEVKIKENIPKIMRSLEALKKIYENKVPKK